MKFLIVEDEYISRSKLKVILSDYGECIEAKNGKEALHEFENALVEKQPFTAVTLDIQMPNLNGHAVAEQIRTLEDKHKLRPAKILMVTGMTDYSNIRSALKHSGANGYLMKPYDQAKLAKELALLGIERPATLA